MPLISNPARRNSLTSGEPRNECAAEVELLRKAGIIKTGPTLEAHMIETMQDVGLGTRNVLSQLALLMNGAESDATKLAAVGMALKLYMHPAMTPQASKAQDKVMPQISFTISVPANSQTQVDMDSILKPNAAKPPVDVEFEPSEQNIKSW